MPKSCIVSLNPKDLLSNNTGEGVGLLDLSKKNSWVLSYNFDKKHGVNGRVILGKIDRIVQNVKSKTFIQLIVSQIRIYDLKQDQIQKINLKGAPIDFLKVHANQALDFSEIHPFDKDLLLAGDFAFEWLGEIYPREGTDSANLRWSSGSTTLTLHNMSDKPKYVDLKMQLATPTDEESQLIVQYSGQREVLTVQGQNRQIYSKILLLPPGQTMVKFTSNAKPIQNGDPRNIVFGVFNFKIDHATE